MIVFKVHFPQLRTNATLFLTFINVNFFKIPFRRPSKFNILQVKCIFITQYFGAFESLYF